MQPLESMPRATAARIHTLFSDIDDTLTTHGRLTVEAYAALDALKAAGIRVVLVTGRPAGWCDHIARMWPVDAVIGENGAFYMWHDADARKLRTRHVFDEATRAAKLLPHGELWICPDAGHRVLWDQPARLSERLKEFLS